MAEEKVVGKQPEEQTDNQGEKAGSQSGRSRPQAGRQTP